MKPIIAFCCLVLFCSSLRAQDTTAVQPPVDITPYASPRATLKTFLSAMDEVRKGRVESIGKAMAALDLSQINPLVRSEKGRDFTWMLLEVLKRKKVSPARVSRVWAKESYVLLKFRHGRIVLQKQADGRWLFSSGTLQALPAILDELVQQAGATTATGNLPWYIQFRSRIPESLKKTFLLLEYWQWLGVLIATIAGVFADKSSRLLLQWLMRRWLRKGLIDRRLRLDADWLRPLAMLVMAGVWWVGLNLLGLSDTALAFLLVPVKVLAALAGVWGGYRLIDVVCAYIAVYAAKTESRLDDALVPLLRKSLKVFATIVGLMFVAANLNINLAGLIAGLGLGGLAFALAAKDLVQNLFGSVSILLDQGFHVGDWVIIDDIEGTVEEIGLRSTRIRSFYNSLVILPNSRLITASIDNMGKRRYRRMK